MGRLCQRRWLLAELALLCLFLPAALGVAAQEVLTRGVDFSGIRLAVTAPEGDELPQLLEQYLGQMRDVSSYCTVEAMAEEEALSALERGGVVAVLRLPEDFARGVMRGDNPDVQVLVNGDQPLTALLTLWVGQSAADLLAAVQSGIYAVLDLWETAPPEGLSRQQAMTEINLRYISWTMNRQEMFHLSEISATGVLPVQKHYALCFLAYFSLALAPLFVRLYSGSGLRFQRRLRAAGRSAAGGYGAAVLASGAVLFPLLLMGLLLLAGEFSAALLPAAAAAALFAAIFASFCCLAAGGAAGCGVLAFLTALLSLALAGGILPPALLPPSLRHLSPVSPVSWMLNLWGRALGYELELSLLPLAATAAVLAVVGYRLFCRRLDGKEGET